MTLTIPGGKATVFSPKHASRPVSNIGKFLRMRIKCYFRLHRRSLTNYKVAKTCIVVSDNTRLTFNRKVIPILLDQLNQLGVRRENVTLLVATGLHAPMSRKELLQDLGERIVRNYRVVNHDPDGKMTFLGVSKYGTPLLINRLFMEADLRIATGIVSPHFHAGFGGGFKSILPGIAGKDTILKNHSFKKVAHENARYGVREGNPIYEEIVEMGKKSGLDLIANVIVNHKQQLVDLLIGPPEETYNQAVSKIAREMRIEFRKRFDVVVTTNGGYPLDRNLYQCVKGIATGELVANNGGTIIMVSECRDGVGHETFQKYLSYGNSARDVLEALKRDEPVEDQDNIQILARILVGHEVIVAASNIAEETLRAMKMIHASSVQDALRMCKWSPQSPVSLAVVPGGPYVLPIETHDFR